ncbi:error-prone DNA polymerase [Lysobacter enzymogenes]|uniref:error-prone DNA polymerase n=1 Tax=Lysobacter enzymogenes TaxID=69 RepID=UPI001A95E8D8|nr:error-prone DNA polymerase [Lysobacter enzymogenes]QQP96906.1 error-prone DNA polymerase [Lysobacter enzymogenes]
MSALPARIGAQDPLPEYAELHCLSAFSFQRGASTAMELFKRAKLLGYSALAITDECTLAGIVRALQAARETGMNLIVGSEIQIADGPKIVLLVKDRTGYASLCGLITEARMRAEKGEYLSLRDDFDDRCGGLLALWIPRRDELDDLHASWLKGKFGDRLWIAVELHRGSDDDMQLADLKALAARHNLPCVAAGDAHMHERGRRELQDTLTAVRHRTTVNAAGERLFPNGERHLRIRKALAAIYPRDMLTETLRIAAQCNFDLKRDLKYEYPRELVPREETPTSWLRKLVEKGAARRWTEGVSLRALDQIDSELSIIAYHGYEAYFLTVHDIVNFARSKDILCQGRGSAANSVVCYALGITEIDPIKQKLLFERFMSRERKEPPDIDVDFEHERREEVLQYVFEHYGRDRAALTAVAISYRGRSAVRDVATALGMPQDQISELSKTLDRWSDGTLLIQELSERGFDPESPVLTKVVELSNLLVENNFPRHLSQHPGGFVISEHALHTLVPVENAAMEKRTIVQWDKDDLDELGILKVDCLALGMLTAVHKIFKLLKSQGHGDMAMSGILELGDDKKVYEMICRADTIGAFQIESRAQMSMLPRLKPTKFYDLVVQIAIVRPGPIQGDMVNPYLLARKKEPHEIEYPKEELKAALGRTLGVPLFQEQVMQIAMIAGKFSADEADALRRSMAAWKRHGGLEPHRKKLTERMLANGYEIEFINRIFEQIKGFGSYGFPESHAASFALIAYVSCWLKHYHPAAFACGIINSMPMGFYTHGQILHDVRRHGVTILPVDVRYSDWDCTLEALPGRGERKHPHAIRMGLRLIAGFDEAAADRISDARAQAPWRDIDDLCERAALDPRLRAVLADAGALRALVGHRHRARWAVAGVDTQLPLFAGVARAEAQVALPLPSAGEDVRADYDMLGTTLGPHPLALLRSALHARRCRRSSQLKHVEHGQRVRFAGLVTVRQHPETASGVTFLSLEDEDGMVNAVVWRDLAQRQRRVLVEARLMAIDGKLERVDGVQHIVAARMEDLTSLLGSLATSSRDFH